MINTRVGAKLVAQTVVLLKRAVMSTQKQTIYFDIGDTLYFSEEMEKQYPQKLYELISVRQSISVSAAKEKLKTASDNLEGKIPHVTKVAAMGSLGFSRAEVHQAFCSVNPSQFLQPNEELNAFLELLSQFYSLGIISNFKKSHALDIFKAIGLKASIFTHFVTEDIVTNIKPDPEPFNIAVKLSGAIPSDCFYVADSISKDLRPAKDVGMQTIWVSPKTLKDDQKQWVDDQVRFVIELKQKFLG